MSKIEKELKAWFDEFNYDTLKKVGLASCMKAYYLGTQLENTYDSSDEIANELELTNQEQSTWEHIWYNKESWFNQ